MKKDNYRTPEFKEFLIDYDNFIEDKNIYEKHFGHFTKGALRTFRANALWCSEPNHNLNHRRYTK